MSEKILVKDLQKLDPGSELVCLYELEYTKGNFIYFMSGLDTDLSTVQMRDYSDNSQINTYIAIPAKMQGLEYKNDGAIARPTVTIANASNAFSNAIGTIDYDTFLGLKFIKRTTLKKYLHGESGATNPPTVLVHLSVLTSKLSTEKHARMSSAYVDFSGFSMLAMAINAEHVCPQGSKSLFPVSKYEPIYSPPCSSAFNRSPKEPRF